VTGPPQSSDTAGQARLTEPSGAAEAVGAAGVGGAVVSRVRVAGADSGLALPSGSMARTASVVVEQGASPRMVVDASFAACEREPLR
jgi:hypothetical protein